MVDISSQNNKVNITVSSVGNKGNIATSPDMSMFYTERSREWAISDKIVNNEDYSSKYYANESKKQAQISTNKTKEVVNSGNEALSNIDNAKTGALTDIKTNKTNAITDIINQEALSVDNVNTVGETQVNNVNSAGTTQINLAKKQVTLATSQATIATEQAEIATAKTTEVVESGNTALSNIATAKSNALSEINTTGVGYVENAERYAQNALTSANNASVSESNALSYKNSALESSQTAIEQAEIATTQAGISTSKAGEAVTSATNAKTSETKAKSSEVRCEEILSRLGTAIKIKGRVDSIGDLPLGDNLDGDAYLVGGEGLDSYPEYYWYQDHWEFLGTSGTSLTWGLISGNITAQTDLMNKLNTKQNVISDLETIRSNASAGKTSSDTISTYGDIVSHNADEFAEAVHTHTIANVTNLQTTLDAKALKTDLANYIPKSFGSANIPGNSTAPTGLVKYGNPGANGYLSSVNIMQLGVNKFFRCYERGASITCNYDNVVANLGKTFCNGSVDGYYSAINPSTSFANKPFVWEVTSNNKFEVSDVLKLQIFGHRLTDPVKCTAYKIEVYAYNDRLKQKEWVTIIDYSGSAVNIAQTGYGMYKPGHTASNPYYNIHGVRLTISGCVDTVFRIAEIVLLANRGTEQPYQALHCVPDFGGTITGNLTVTGTINGTASKATADGNGNNIVNTYATKTSLNTKADTSLSNLTEEGIQVIKDNSGGSGLEVCDIGVALYVDETKGLRRYLNGQIVDINTNTQAFLNRLKQITTLHPSLLCTEEEWQTAKTMSAFGQVGKFVFNYSGDNIVSVRLPRVVNVQGLFDLQNLGMTVPAGLPNHTHTLTLHGRAGDNAHTNRDASWCYDDWVGGNQTATTSQVLNNAIYGKSTTVQQEAIQYPYFIQIATGQETENNIVNDIELNNPYVFGKSEYSKTPKDNLSWLASKGQWNPKGTYPAYYDWILENVNKGTEDFKLSTDTYDDYSWVINTADETFRLPLLDGSEDLPSAEKYIYTLPTSGGQQYTALYNGIIQLNATSSAANQYVSLINRTTGEYDETRTPLSGTGNVCNIQVKAGDTFTVYGDNISTITWLANIKYVGNGSLYYYVGETVQNAKLIDAGRIGEILPTKTDMQQAAKASMPSDRYIDLTLGASGATYTAPANGYFQLAVLAGTSIQFYNNTKANFWKASSSTGIAFAESIECQAGDIIQCYYEYTTFRWFRFYYAEGSK